MSNGRRSTAITMVMLSLISVLSKALGFVRDQVIARSFGASAVTDAYIAAQIAPALVIAVISGAISILMVPMFTNAQAVSKQQLRRTVWTNLVFVTGLYVALAAVLWVYAADSIRIFVPGLNQAAVPEAIILARIFALTVPLWGLADFHSALLNVHGRFMLPAIATLCSSIAVAAASILRHDHITIRMIAWAVVCGYAVQLLLLLVDVNSLRIRYWGSAFRQSAIRHLVALAWPLVLANLVGQFAGLGEVFIASFLNAGSITSLNYAGKLLQIPSQVINLALSSILFARFSALAAKKEKALLASEVGRTVQGLVFVLVPATALLISLATPLVSVAFERGQFDRQAVASTSGVLVYYGTGLLAMAALPIVIKILTAFENTRAALVANIIGTAVYLPVAWMMATRWAHLGLAGAFSLSQIIVCAVAGVALIREVGIGSLRKVIRALPLTILATVAAVAAVWAVKALTTSAIKQVTFAGAAGIITYLGVYLLLSGSLAGYLRDRQARYLKKDAAVDDQRGW